MSDIIKRKISDRCNRKSGVSRNHILEHTKIDMFPSIMIDDQIDIIIEDGILYYGDSKIFLMDKLIVDIVRTLRDNGVNCFLVNQDVAAYPAILLDDIRSSTAIQIDVNSSPVRLSEHHAPTSMNLVTIDESKILRNIAVVADGNQSYLDDNSEFSYEVENGLLYVNNIGINTKCIMTYKISKYFLFSKRENVLNAHNAIDKYSRSNVYSHILLDTLKAINSNNKDS
jgi:hypothetical protein